MHPPLDSPSQEIQSTKPAVLVWASNKLELTLREPKFKSFNKGREVQKAPSQSNSLLNPACMTRPDLKNNMPCSYCFNNKTSWWFQPNWKLCASNCVISTGRDEDLKKYLKAGLYFLFGTPLGFEFLKASLQGARILHDLYVSLNQSVKYCETAGLLNLLLACLET